MKSKTKIIEHDGVAIEYSEEAVKQAKEDYGFDLLEALKKQAESYKKKHMQKRNVLKMVKEHLQKD